MLLELARVLPERLAGQEVWLVFFDGEDSGGLDGWEWHAGASTFAAQLTAIPQAVVVVDMVGDADLQLPVERNYDPALVKEIWDVAERLGAGAFVQEPGASIIDDHRPFVDMGIPAVLIIDLDSNLNSGPAINAAAQANGYLTTYVTAFPASLNSTEYPAVLIALVFELFEHAFSLLSADLS